MKDKEENKMKYNTLRIIRQLLKNELEGMEREMTVLNNDLKKLDPDGLLPETDPRVEDAEDRKWLEIRVGMCAEGL